MTMVLPVPVEGMIARRLLLNYRVDPSVLSDLLPAGLEPLRVGGFGIVGVCLIRLESMRPRFVPRVCGISSENAGYRIAVEWTEGDDLRQGVFLPRRDSNSWLNRAVGGRLFPGVHHAATFQANENSSGLTIEVTSRDGLTDLLVSGRECLEINESSVFDGLEELSLFFECAGCGYSSNRGHDTLDGVRLNTKTWTARGFHVEKIRSNYFDNKDRFPEGSISFDSAMFMSGIAHQWIPISPFQISR